MKLKIAIILVNYNGFCDTIECINSIKNCDYANYSIIVVDNCSQIKPSEDEIQYIENNADFIRLDTNLGFSGGNNVGIKFAKDRYDPDYYLLLNNDTVVTFSFLNELLEVYESKLDAGIVCGKIKWFDDKSLLWYDGGEYNSKISKVSHTNYNCSDIENNTIRKVTFATGCMWLIKKDVLFDVGLLSEEYFLYSEDLDYCCRVLKKGYSIYYCPKSLIYHKVSRSTGMMSYNSQYYICRNELYILKKYSENRFLSYLYYFYKTFRRLIIENYSIKPVFKAIVHFIVGRRGAI